MLDTFAKVLIGGGILTLVSLMGGIILWVKTMVGASREYVNDARSDLAEALKRVRESDKNLRRANLRVDICERLREQERTQFRRWVIEQKEWSTTLVAEVESLGGHVKSPPAFPICSMDQDEFPDDHHRR